MSVIYRDMEISTPAERSDHRATFINALKQAEDATKEFCRGLSEHTRAIYLWVDPALEHERGYEFAMKSTLSQQEQIQLVCKIVSQLEHTDEHEREATDVIRCPGLIAVDKNFLPIVE